MAGERRDRTDQQRQEIRDALQRRLLRVLEREGITQSELARRLGLAQPSVNAWFREGAVPDATNLALIAAQFGINVHYLVTGQGPEVSPEGDAGVRAFSAGARAVVTEMRRVLDRLQFAYAPERLATGAPTEDVLASANLARRGTPPQGKRSQARRR